MSENRPLRLHRADAEPSNDREAVPRLDTQTIFRGMIEREIRDGRLSPMRRRRIVRYAARLGLGPMEAGRLVEECRREVDSDRLTRDEPVPRLAEPAPRGVSPWAMFCLALGGVIVAQWLMARLLG